MRPSPNPLSSTYGLRCELATIARRDVNKVEVTKNQAPWIAKLWPATTYPDGMKNREPYCVTGLCYVVREWGKNPKVLDALKMTADEFEKWRPKSAAVADWKKWAKNAKGVKILPRETILHMGDIAIYSYSHGELVVDDDGTINGPYEAIGYNTNAAASRDGEGCFEKPRNRSSIEMFIRILQ